MGTPYCGSASFNNGNFNVPIKPIQCGSNSNVQDDGYSIERSSIGTPKETASLFKFQSPLHAYLNATNKIINQSSTPGTSVTSQSTFQASWSAANASGLSNATYHTYSSLDNDHIAAFEPIDINDDDDSICSFDVTDLQLSNEIAEATSSSDLTQDDLHPNNHHPVVSSMGPPQMSSSTASLNHAFERMYSNNDAVVQSSNTANASNWNNITTFGNASCPSLFSPHMPTPSAIEPFTNSANSNFASGFSNGMIQMPSVPFANFQHASQQTSCSNDASNGKMNFQGNMSCPSFNFEHDQSSSSLQIGGQNSNASFNNSASYVLSPAAMSNKKKALSASRLSKKMSSSSSSSLSGRRKKIEIPGKNSTWSSPNGKAKRRIKASTKSSKSSSSSSSKERCMTYSGLILRRVNSKKTMVNNNDETKKTSRSTNSLLSYGSMNKIQSKGNAELNSSSDNKNEEFPKPSSSPTTCSPDEEQ